MKFIKIYLIIAVLFIILTFFCGFLIESIKNPYVIAAVCAIPAAAIVTAFISLTERIDELEKKIAPQEEN